MHTTKQQSSLNSIHIEEIRTVADLEAMKPDWNTLLNKCKRREIYLTYEWMISWWRCFEKDGKSLMVLIIRAGENIIGIAPLIEERERLLGLPMKTIKFMSMADYADSPANCATSLDMIIPDMHEEIIPAIFTHLTAHHDSWNVIRLNPIPESSKTIDCIAKEAAKRQFRMKSTTVYTSAFIDVTTNWQGYVSELSSRFTKSLRAQERRLQEKGIVTYQEFNVNGDADALYDSIIDIEKRSWKWDVGVSINSVALGNFYKIFAQEAAKQSWLRVWMMQVNGKNIAYDYLTNYQGHLVSLKTSYDNEYRNYGPGNLLTLREFQRFFEDGTKQISLMWGDLANKQRWKTKLEDHHEIYIFGKSFYASILYFLIITCSLIRVRRIAIEWKNRLARKIGLHLSHSELTRLDQVNT